MIYTNKIFIKMKKVINIKTVYTFREVDGIWQRVDSQEPKPPTLAEFLQMLDIIIDENTQFCRIIKYEKSIKQTIIYRAYTGAKVQICLHTQTIY